MSEQDSSLRPLSEAERVNLEQAVSMYEKALVFDLAAMQYLKARGFEQETWATYRLGVVTEPFYGHGYYRGRLAIPYLASDGHPLSVRFRCIQPHDCKLVDCRKYLTQAGEHPRMFNVGAISRPGDEIHLAEGELDALMLEQVGFPAVAIPGAKLWQVHHAKMLAGFSRVFIWADPDDAGAELARKVLNSLPRSAKLVQLKHGDVGETFLSQGADELIRVYREAGGKAR